MADERDHGPDRAAHRAGSTCAEPLRRQLVRELRDSIRARRLRTGVRLPSSRLLAEELGVSRGVVTDAYEQLAAEGWLIARSGAGTTVAAGAVTPRGAESEPRAQRPAIRFDFTPVSPDVSMFPRRLWARAVARAAVRAADAELDYGSGHGSSALREALAGYLGRVRGTGRLLVGDRGLRRVQPGHHVALRRPRAARSPPHRVRGPVARGPLGYRRARGLESVPVSLDAEGLRVDELAASGADAVVVTPNHQFPTGAVMGPERRRSLLQWARGSGRLVIEDDYDAEFRDLPPSLAARFRASIPTGCCTSGTASKSLAPGLRLGWMLSPPGFASRRPLAAGRSCLNDGGSSALDRSPSPTSWPRASWTGTSGASGPPTGGGAGWCRRLRRRCRRPGSRCRGGRPSGTRPPRRVRRGPAPRRDGGATAVEARLIEPRRPASVGQPTRLVLGYGRLATAGVEAAVAALGAAVAAAERPDADV